MKPSSVTSTVDFDRSGVQHGYLTLPHSSDKSAWGSIMIPITVIQNDEGPTAVLIGGNHGDEYEGPIALHKLAASLQSPDITGRIIIIPALNMPAVQAATRTSPIDGGNMNRSFPGNPEGTVTQRIADYIQREVLPLADIVLDIHSGGSTLEFLPFAASHVLADKEQEERCAAARDAFAAPYAMQLLEMDSGGMLDTAAEELGKTFVTTELGGGGSATARTIGIAERGVRNLLCHAGILPEDPEGQTGMRLTMPDAECYTICQNDGLLEPCVDLGSWVEEGDIIAQVYDPVRIGAYPFVYRAAKSGVLVGRHFPGMIRMGDCLAALGVPEDVTNPRLGRPTVQQPTTST